MYGHVHFAPADDSFAQCMRKSRKRLLIFWFAKTARSKAAQAGAICTLECELLLWPHSIIIIIFIIITAHEV